MSDGATKAKNAALPKLVLSLASSQLLKPVTDQKVALRSQRSSLQSLLSRRSRGVTDEYTTAYDSMMRLAEIATIQHGYQFGDMPHRALKDIQLTVWPGSSIDEVVRIRHLAKKRNYSPTAAELELLLTERQRLADELGLTTLLRT